MAIHEDAQARDSVLFTSLAKLQARPVTLAISCLFLTLSLLSDWRPGIRLSRISFVPKSTDHLRRQRTVPLKPDRTRICPAHRTKRQACSPYFRLFPGLHQVLSTIWKDAKARRVPWSDSLKPSVGGKTHGTQRRAIPNATSPAGATFTGHVAYPPEQLDMLLQLNQSKYSNLSQRHPAHLAPRHLDSSKYRQLSDPTVAIKY